MTAEIWILRHDEAEPAGPGGDAARRLTPEGEAHAAKLALKPARVVSSPLVRARRTAALAAPGLEVEIDPRLAPGRDAEAVAADALAEGPHPVLLVGHNPDLESVVFALTGTAVPLGKGTLVRVAVEDGRGRVV
jgi:phosphohistidine phosphatase